MDPDFQQVLHSSVQRDTLRLGVATLTIVGDEEHGRKGPSAGALKLPTNVSSQNAGPSLSVLWRVVRGKEEIQS